MTAPAQDAPQDNPFSFTLDAGAHVAALEHQRNQAMDEAARWRAIALQERAANLELARRLADKEGEQQPAG